MFASVCDLLIRPPSFPASGVRWGAWVCGEWKMVSSELALAMRAPSSSDEEAKNDRATTPYTMQRGHIKLRSNMCAHASSAKHLWPHEGPSCTVHRIFLRRGGRHRVCTAAGCHIFGSMRHVSCMSQNRGAESLLEHQNVMEPAFSKSCVHLETP